MEQNLFQAYYWLSSAIVQAFAALIALTGMFYIYRINRLNKAVDSTWNTLIKILSEDCIITHKIPTKATMGTVNLHECIILARRVVAETSDHVVMVNIQKCLDTFEGLSKIYTRSIIFAPTSIILSALTVATGIFGLLFGLKICPNQIWLLMIAESILAIISLSWTVITVLSMLHLTKKSA